MAWNTKQRQAKVARIRKRDGNTCWLCHEAFERGEKPTIDHAIPKGRGGSNHISNLRLAHLHCNQQRGMIVQTPPRAATLRAFSVRLSILKRVEATSA